MPSICLARDLSALLARLKAEPDKAAQLQPQLQDLVTRMQASGEPIPPDAQTVVQRLTDDAVEQMFDNLPI